MRKLLLSISLLAAWLMASAPALAHCDGLDGPVVRAAQKALDAGDVRYVLIWVRPEHETEIRQAFNHTVAVRKLGAPAKVLADRYFFETLVRVHRAGEGAPYTGLKPAGRDIGPAIPAADRAIQEGSLAPVDAVLTRATHEGLQEAFTRVMAHRQAASGSDVAEGREYVEAYVTFIHYVERLYEAARHPAAGHHEETQGSR